VVLKASMFTPITYITPFAPITPKVVNTDFERKVRKAKKQPGLVLASGVYMYSLSIVKSVGVGALETECSRRQRILRNARFKVRGFMSVRDRRLMDDTFSTGVCVTPAVLRSSDAVAVRNSLVMSFAIREVSQIFSIEMAASVRAMRLLRADIARDMYDSDQWVSEMALDESRLRAELLVVDDVLFGLPSLVDVVVMG
jgi:hypothetical protein